MEGNIWFIIKILPLLVASMVIAGFIGWYLRCKIGKCHGHHHVVAEPSKHDDHGRYKKLQEKLHQTEAAWKTARTDLESLEKKSAPLAEYELLQSEVNNLRNSFAHEKQRADTVDTELRKAQETISSFHNKANIDVKEQNDRTFVLENELSKAREQLLRFQSAGDDSAELRKELASAQETAANATRYAGESRKREAALSEMVDSLKGKLDAMQTNVSTDLRPRPFVSAAPAMESETVLKAKADVARLNAERVAREQTERKAAEEKVIADARAEAVRVAAETVALAKAEQERLAAKTAVAEVAEVATPTEPEAATKIAHASEILGKRVLQDDLKIVEGIGPKIEELLQAGGINTWSLLAEAPVERLQQILSAAGESYAIHNPATWSRQAALAATGGWAELRSWQDELDGGKEMA